MKLTINLDALFNGLSDFFDLEATLDVVEDRCAQKKVGQEQHQQDHPLLLGHVPPEGGRDLPHYEEFLFLPRNGSSSRPIKPSSRNHRRERLELSHQLQPPMLHQHAGHSDCLRAFARRLLSLTMAV